MLMTHCSRYLEEILMAYTKRSLEIFFEFHPEIELYLPKEYDQQMITEVYQLYS
jgi:hypothetical protein